MYEFICVLGTKISNPGLIPCMQGIFDQAMHHRKYHWGCKAKLAAGAVLGIALCELHKSDSLCDIAVSLLSPLPTFTWCLSYFRVLKHVLTCCCVSTVPPQRAAYRCLVHVQQSRGAAPAWPVHY